MYVYALQPIRATKLLLPKATSQIGGTIPLMRCLATIPLAVCLFLTGLAFGQNSINTKTELANLQKLENLQVASKTKFQKAPKDAKKRKEYISLTLTLANNVQASMALSSKEKYPKSLRLYREVLKTDPKNAEAKENKERIEMIYRSMGRPIPK